MMMTKAIRTALFGGTMLALAGAAQADTLRYAGGWPPGSGPNGALENYAATLEGNSGGSLKMKVFPLTLLSFAESNAGLKDGIADLSTVLTPYFSAEFPTLNMVSEFSTLVELADYTSELSSLAFAAAVSEYVILNCPSCQEEVAKQNQVYMGAGMTTSYALQCTVPVTSPEELKGKRVRAGGAYWARWAEAMGAVPVSISINETFEALSQGVLDCTASNPAELINFSFVDVVKYVYQGLPGGQFTVPTMINRDRWQGLTTEERTALMKSNATLAAEMTWVYLQEARAGVKKTVEKGNFVGQADASLISQNQAFIESDLEAIVGNYKDKFGIENGAEASAKMRELVARWSGLVQGIDNPQALADLYWNEIYSKVDASSYGM